MRNTALILLLIGAGSLAGCEPVALPAVPSQTNGGASALSAASDARRLLSSDNGLEMREWVIMDRESRIGAAIAQLGQAGASQCSCECSSHHRSPPGVSVGSPQAFCSPCSMPT